MKLKQTVAGETTFYWDSNSDPYLYSDFRVPSDDDATTRGNLENIAPEEVASAIKKLIDIQVGLKTCSVRWQRFLDFHVAPKAWQKPLARGLI